jgi:hypothetical protein
VATEPERETETDQVATDPEVERESETDQVAPEPESDEVATEPDRVRQRVTKWLQRQRERAETDLVATEPERDKRLQRHRERDRELPSGYRA